MRQILLTLSIVFCGASFAAGQTTATNFTATDCNSSSHTLFTELDAGKIVVLVWVMPCGTCISDAKGAFDAVGTFATSHPGKVVFYLSDDVGNVPCNSLNAWATSNGMAGATTFANAGNVIDENNYGGNGMPHVVVMGGTDHKIYLNLRSGSNNFTTIKDAITTALTTTAVEQVAIGSSDVMVYPNPATNGINVGCAIALSGPVSLDVFDVRGVKVQSATEHVAAGQQNINLALGNALSNGYYMLRLSTAGTSKVVGFAVAR